MIKIRHAGIGEKKKTYEWLCLSDTTSMHMGPPDYPESPIPNWDEFQEDFEDFYYLAKGCLLGSVMIIENDGSEIGCLCYACFHLKPERAELDIWLKSKEYCGKGHGPAALELMIKYLKDKIGINRFMIRPSERNICAIKAYDKAGFRRAKNKKNTLNEYLQPEFVEKYGKGDYGFDKTAVFIME
jgi:RimJ/RimL family protein N-acetyltransferase